LSDASTHLAGLLDSQYRELCERWAARAGARTGRAPELGEHLPWLLRSLIDELRSPEPEGDAPASVSAQAASRFQRAFDLEAVVYEYGLLQRIVLELLEMASVPVSMRDVRRLGDWFTRAVAAAAAEQALAGHDPPGSEVDTRRSVGQGRERGFPGAAPEPVHRMSWDADVMMQAPMALSVVRGHDFVYAFANPLALAMAGHRDVLGKSVRQAFPELDESAPVLQVLEQVYASAEAFNADEYQVPLDRKGDGVLEDVYFKFTCQPIRGDDERVREILIVAADVTAQVQARQRVEALMHELTLTDRRKDEFLAMLAHELRNPIAAISAALTLLDQVQGDAARSGRYRDTARRQLDSLVRLVDDLLDVARLTRGKVELRKEQVDLATIVQNALGATRPVLEARQHELSVTLTSGAFRILADATRLEQVLVNLLSNAAKYTEPGGRIGVRLARDDDAIGPFALLSVRDTGRGIPADMLQTVFDLFTQVSPSIDRSTGGLGLGLTLVKHLVEKHGGRVWASSAGVGQGSEFSIRLPLLGEDASAAQIDEPQLSPSSSRRSVVLVEDSEDVRELMKECIEHLGHAVLVAEDGLEGVRVICRARPALALIDVGLPGIDGYEVARRVRSELRGHSMRLVALTGYGGAEVVKAAHEAGFDEHIVKPIDIDQLRRVLAAAPTPG
jgi:signal transduction histidine kinase